MPDPERSVTERVERAIRGAIEELNLALAAGARLSTAADTVLVGAGGQLASLDLINLVVGTEERIEDEFGVSVALADLVAEGETDRIATVGALCASVVGLLAEAGAGSD